MQTKKHWIDNGAGWLLSLTQTWHEQRLDRSRRPVLIVPGYGMNSFIFSFHPTGLSLEGYLADAGFEVWRVDLRAQGDSESRGGTHQFSLEDLALTDLTAVVAAALAATHSNRDRVDVLGASLGGTLMFLHAAFRPAHRLGTMVSIASPVRWLDVHPLIKLAFASPRLVGLVPIRGARSFAALLLPQLARLAPSLLALYMNPEITDIQAAREMVRTVENPNRYINRQLARWVQRSDLVVAGESLSDALARITAPLCCVVANRDGIVPRQTAEFAYHHVGSTEKRLLVVGTDLIRVAHADLFVSNQAHARVFQPIVEWLAAQS